MVRWHIPEEIMIEKDKEVNGLDIQAEIEATDKDLEYMSKNVSFGADGEPSVKTEAEEEESECSKIATRIEKFLKDKDFHLSQLQEMS